MILGRVFVGLSLLAAWASLGRVLTVDGLPYATGAAAALAPLTSRLGAALGTGLFLAVLVAFTRRPGPAAAGALAGLLALGAWLQSLQWPPGVGVNGAVMLPGAAMTAWALAGLLRRPEHGLEAAAGIVGACYFLAGVSKVTSSGFAWASGANVGLHIAQQAWVGQPIFRPFRLFVANSETLCAALGVGTLCIELGMLAFVFPRARLPLALTAVAMHVGIALLMNLHHYDWMFMAVGVALWSRR